VEQCTIVSRYCDIIGRLCLYSGAFLLTKKELGSAIRMSLITNSQVLKNCVKERTSNATDDYDSEPANSKSKIFTQAASENPKEFKGTVYTDQP
jgi:hypothetical protein